MDVLLVEPDAVLAKTYQQVFESAGLETVFCHDGQLAVIIIDKQKPKAIVLEPQLAGHSGIEFLHELRSYEDWADIPVFMLSSVPEYAFGIEQSQWRTLGVERYFYKPKSSVRQVAGIIKSVIDANT